MNFIIDNFDKLFNSEESLKRLEEIILDLAVKGKLVPQDPNDEPASVLLEKIKAEKEQLIKDKKIKKDKELPLITEEEIPFEIPESWQWVRLGEIGLTQTGTTPSTSVSEYFNGEIPFIKPADISREGINYNNESLTKKGLEKGRLIKENSVLMVCIGGSAGKSNYIDRDCSCNQQINAITGYGNISAKFIDWFMNSQEFQVRMLSKATGTATPIINKSKWDELLFPLPPLTEQKRIVEKVDKLKELINQFREKIQKRDKVRQGLKASIMNEIEKSNSNHDLLENLELIFRNFDTVVKTKEDIKDIRDLVLSLAVKGKLVPQDPIDEPANILLEKIKVEKEQLIKEKKIKKDKDLSPISEEEIPFEIPDSWEWVRLGEILTKLTDGAHQTPKYTEIGVPFISVKDLSSGIIDFSNTRFISEEEHKELYKRCDPQYGDLLLTKVGTTGIPKVVDTETEFSLFVSVALLKFNKQSLFNYFLEYLIKSPLVQKQVDENTKGVGNKNWVLKAIANTLIILPPLAEQKRIVLQVEKLMKVCDELEKLVEKSQKEESLLMGSIINGIVG